MLWQKVGSMKKVLYISHGGLPTNAPGVRIFNIGTLLEQAGCSIHYISNERVGDRDLNSGYERTDPTEYPYLEGDECHFKIGGKLYSYLPKATRGGKLFALSETLELISARRAFSRVVKYCEREKPHMIILYNTTSSITKRLIPYCKKRGIMLYADVTEWYERSHATSMPAKIKAYLCERRIIAFDKKLDGVIAISEYLKEYYDSHGARSMWLPPLMEMEIKPVAHRHEYYPGSRAVNFVYAGAPGSKDILLPFVRAVQRLNSDGIKARFDIVGISPSYFDGLDGIGSELEATGIVAHGRLPRKETMEIVERADFGVLLRHDKRYAKAGFSTKFAEAMCLGVPMLCNPIGGCDTMVEHMKNGLIVSGFGEDELLDALQEVVGMSDEKILEMKNCALDLAKTHFVKDAWLEALSEFMRLGDKNDTY